MKHKKRILLIGELYRPLIPWLLEDKAPKGVPAVYNLYQYLGNSDQYQFHSIVFNREINKIKTFPNGSVIELKKFSFPNYYIWKLLVFFRLFFWGNTQIRSKKFDLIYGLSTFATIAALLGKWNKIPSVGRIYGTILTRPLAERKYFKLYTRFLFDIIAIKIPADRVICTLDGTQYDEVFNFFNKKRKVQLLYNGMDQSLRSQLLSFPNTKKLSPAIRFCYIARLESYKRQELAIQIIDRLVNYHNQKEIQLTIIGSGNREEELKRMVEEKNLQDSIVFIREMPHKDIPDFIKNQDAAMFFYEGGSLGNILWESAMAGKLIVTIDNAGTGELFKDGINSLIAPDNEQFPTIMADKIHTYINQDIGTITEQSRSLVAGLIKSWEERFDNEFKNHF